MDKIAILLLDKHLRTECREVVMNKFKQLVYIRPNVKEVKKEFKTLIKHFKKAESYDKAKQIYFLEQNLFENVATNYIIADVRNKINTSDEFYEEEIKFFNQELPRMMLIAKKGREAILKSKFKEDFDKEFGKHFTDTIKSSQRTMNFKVMLNLIKENNLETAFTKKMASCKAVFKDEECNFYGILKYMQSIDREERKEAFKVFAKMYEDISPELDELYDKMLSVRVKMAKKLKFSNYIEFAYLNRERLDYGPKEVELFRNQVIKHIVPVCKKLYQEQEKALGVDKLKYYDEEIMFADGSANPVGDKAYMLKAAQKMYRELSKETAEFFDFMLEYEMFDLETKPNKHLGGFCTVLPKFKAPFIFSNFNGTSADVDVLTHEAGHAFEAYTSMREQSLFEYVSSTSEINEIHSMAMEHFTYPWMEDFFGENVNKYKYSHMAKSLMVIPYMCCVDEFQHEAYKTPKMTSKERRNLWRGLEKKYMPWRDYDGNKFFEEGGFWMQKQHIFLYPFYYIDYALAQICVFELYGRMKEDKDAAWQDYYNLCKAGGSKGYFELLGLANLKNPFEEGTVQKAVDIVLDDLRTSVMG